MPKLTQLQTVTLLIALVTILVRSMTLLRDSLIAGSLGLGGEADHFFLLIDYSNFLTTLVATSAINLFIPRIKNHSFNEDFSSKYITLYTSKFFFFLLITLPLILTGFIFFTSFSIELIVICCLIFISQSLCQYFATIINLKQKFLLPSFLFGLPILATFLFFIFNLKNAESLLGLFLVGSLLQAFLSYRLMIGTFKTKFSFQLLSLKNYLLGLKSWLWLALATLYFPASNFLNIQLASYLEEGSISAISYSSRIPFAVANVLIFAFWSVALPTTEISKKNSPLNKQVFSRLAKIGSLAAVFSLIGVALSHQIVSILYGHSDRISSTKLAGIVEFQTWYFYILTIQVLVSLLIRYLHIIKETRATIIVCSIGLFLQIALFWVAGKGLWSIPAGFSINFLVVGVGLAAFVFFKLRRRTQA